jgi:hypothetical protein
MAARNAAELVPVRKHPLPGVGCSDLLAIRVWTISSTGELTEFFYVGLGYGRSSPKWTPGITRIIPLKNHALIGVYVTMICNLRICVVRRKICQTVQNVRRGWYVEDRWLWPNSPTKDLLQWGYRVLLQELPHVGRDRRALQIDECT